MIGFKDQSSKSSPRLVSLATVLPPHVIEQQQAKAFVASLFAGKIGRDDARLLEVFDHSGIERRHVCMPLEWFASDRRFGEINACYIEQALELAAEVTRRVLSDAGLSPGDVDHVVFVSSTGVATPSLDARLANRLGFGAQVRRTPIWGLGCAGGVSGLSRAREFAIAHPESRVLMVALELCSLAFQRRDFDRRHLVATALFSDGAAAALVAGSEAPPAPRPAHLDLELVDSSSTLWPGTLDVMGWEVDEAGLHVVFSRDIPTIVRRWVRPDLEAFLEGHGLDLGTLTHLVAHPGGPKVLAAYSEALELPERALHHAREVLRTCGNMSSPTCLFVLQRFLEAHEIEPGDTAVLAALGPGFASEYLLARGVSA